MFEDKSFEVDANEYTEFLKWKQSNHYLTTNTYPSTILWEKLIFKLNPYLSKGLRVGKNIKAFVKKYPKDNNSYNIQLQIWFGKTLYLFDILDATEEQQEYNLINNIKKV
jgi:hypothetical protein